MAALAQGQTGMHFSKQVLLTSAAVCAVTILATNCGLRRKAYENPITKDTQQPDKVLFDRAINDVEHGRYETARLTLNVLLNTYDSSEYLAKAKLAIADSWYREGGAHGLAQAEAEYKDFELFYPNMEESAEAQWRVCQIHYRQMEKVDRDNSQALRAEDECRLMITTYPNSRYTAKATQMLRDVQEVLAEKEYRTGVFYHEKGAFPAAANRLSFVSKQFPLFSGCDEALWQEADSFRKMGDRFDEQQAAALSRLVREYPLSGHVDEAKDQLEAMKRPIPPADPAAYERMKYEQAAAAAAKPGMVSRATAFMKRGPDTHMSAKTGNPAMETLRPPTPVSVPAATAGEATPAGAGGVTDVSAQTVSDTTQLDSKPDARANGGSNGTAAPNGSTDGAPAASSTPSGASNGAAASGTTAPPPTNHPLPAKKQKKSKKQKNAEPPPPPPAQQDSSNSLTGSSSSQPAPK
jgi:outer membrane protein assembly factor BamD